MLSTIPGWRFTRVQGLTGCPYFDKLTPVAKTETGQAEEFLTFDKEVRHSGSSSSSSSAGQ